MKKALHFSIAFAIVLTFSAVFATTSNAQVTPTAHITSETQTICEGGTPTITFQVSGSSTFSVTYGDNNGGVYTVTGTVNETTSVDGHPGPLPAGNYVFSIISVSGPAGTSFGGAGSTSVIVNSAPSASFISPSVQTLCSGSYGAVVIQLAGGSGANYSVTYQVNDGSNVVVTNVISPSTYLPINVSTSTAGTFTYTITGVSDDLGCTGTFSGSATVNVEQPMTGSFTSTSIQCHGGGATVTVWASGGGGNLTYALCNNTVIGPRPEKAYKLETTCLCFSGPPETTRVAIAGPTECTLQSPAQANGGVYTFTNVPAGTYNVLVADSLGCITNLGKLCITQPKPIFAEKNVTNPSCFDSTNGSICLTNICGGTAPYTFSKDGGLNFVGSTSGSRYTFRDLHAGTYTIVIKDANGCTKQLCTVTLTQPDPITANVTATSACETGTGTITVDINREVVYRKNTSGRQLTGAKTNFECFPTLSISGGIYGNGQTFQSPLSSVPPGTYTISAYDDCVDCGNVVGTVTVPGCGGFTGILGTTNAVCNGGRGSVNIISVTGGTGPYKFSLDGISYIDGELTGPTIINVVPGVYNVYVKDALGAVQILGTTTVTQPTPVTGSIVVGTAPTCASGGTTSLTVTASGGTGTYTFSLDGGTGQPSNIFFTGTGTHNVLIADAVGCTGTAAATVSGTAILSVHASITNNTCYNGLSGQISVNATGGSGTVTFTLRGPNNLQTSQSAAQGVNVSFSGLGAGSYSITAVDASNCPTVSTMSVTQPTPSPAQGNNNVPDLLLTSVINPPTATFAPGSTVTITYTISVKNNGNIAATGVILRISKPFSGYQIQLTGNSQNSWMIITDNAQFTEIQLKPGLAIPCSGSSQVGITIVRSGAGQSPGIPVTASIRLPGSPQDVNDQDNARSSQFRIQ